MHETSEELERLQAILDDSAARAGAHLSEVITEERRLSARELCDTLQGMRLLVVATSTADGRPIAGPVDGYFLHGSFFFSSSYDSVRMRHLGVRPAISASHLPGEHLGVSVHGRAELFDLADPSRPELREAMLGYYLPKQGPDFQLWLDSSPQMGAKINAEKVFTFRLGH